MQSNNPVFRNSDAFNGSSTNAYGNQTYPGNGATHDAYGQAAQTGYADPHAPAGTGERMTIDSVVQKTAMSLGIVILTAAVTWFVTGDIRTSEDNLGDPVRRPDARAASAPSRCRWSTRSSAWSARRW